MLYIYIPYYTMLYSQHFKETVGLHSTAFSYSPLQIYMCYLFFFKIFVLF
jgi:hypothetical protein